MGTRVAQNNQEGSEMPGKLNIKNHVRKLTIECLKAFESNLDHKSNFESKKDCIDLPAKSDFTPSETIVILKDGTEDVKDDVKSHEIRTSTSQDPIDGVDSGVEVIRALSSNGSNSDRYTPAQSCGSSLLSCYSEMEGDRISECGSENSKDGKTKVKTIGKVADGSKTASVATKSDPSQISSRRVSDKDLSESCSENSSTCESQNVSHSKRLSEPHNRMVPIRLAGKKSEGKTPTPRRADSTTRISSRDKSGVRTHSTVRASSSAAERAAKSRPSKPLHASSSCKVDDGRWPSAAQKSENKRKQPANEASKKVSNIMSSSVVSANLMTSSFNGKSLGSEAKSNALDKYGTLPRRPKRKSLENTGEGLVNQTLTLVRSSSVSREPSLNRAATLRRQQSREKEQGNLANGKSLPPYPKTRKSTGKTVIYHEISIQTSVTGEDISNILAGVLPPDPIITPAVEKANKAVQSEGREKLKEMEECYSKQSQELENEKKENERLKKERDDILLRICKMLGYAELRSGSNSSGECELSELEQHFRAVGLTVIQQREELSELRHFKSIMQRDLEKSFAAQKTLLQQQQDIEAEYFELQEFLQAEKTALSESLNDTEAELEKLRKEVFRKEELLQRQQEECKHLVRICEQRRQENLSLEAKLSGLEQRSRDVIVQQGAAVSGAAVALSGLGARLDTLVEQLAISCNISEKDLEDVIYHNEVYAQGQSADNSPDELEPKRFGDDGDSPKKGTSFLNAIIGALRSATQSPIATGKKNSLIHSQNDHSDPLSLLEPENDHCLIIEENASSTSNYTDCVSCSSRGELIKYDICDDAITLVPNGEYETNLSRSDSIQNLSAAILARQEIEKIERNLSPDVIIPTEVNSLVDKVIDIDNLLTKLLKVLRIIQLENDVSLEQLEDQRSDLAEKLHQEQLCRQKMEEHLQQLQYELKDARSQLSLRIVQLEQAKMMLNKDARNMIADSQRQFAAIHNAIGTLESIQEVVNQCPPLAKLQQDLQDCNHRSTSGDDLNANTPGNGNLNKTIVKEVKRNCSVLTTAV